MKIYWIGLLAAVLALPIVPTGRAVEVDPKPDAKDVTELMRRKLTGANHVLEGIATNDFDKIARNADDLIAVSKAAEWKVVTTAQYELYSNEFRRNADALGKAAREKNLDGTALAYVDMTLTCVKCHKYVREVRMTRRD